MSLKPKSKEELMEGAKKFLSQWKELGFEDEFKALDQWEIMMFQITRVGNISTLHDMKEELREWLLTK